MQVTNIDNTIKDKYDVKNGVLVTSVDNFSEAFMRGIRENYVITEADKKKISNVDDLAEIVNGKKDGDSILMRIVTPDKQERIVAVEIQ
jgi:S1-C subfamily serine protease